MTSAQPPGRIGDATADEVDQAFLSGLMSRAHDFSLEADPPTSTLSWAWRIGWFIGGTSTALLRRRRALKRRRLPAVREVLPWRWRKPLEHG
ncbi:hypothetical protein [Gephyromycinifex aptenodytis]|uniref:hypothetical protein n=1 Tax=Gephyromycinifex aptenodytis TaxID=2716227 RepID=UPI001447C4FD|nr:hypothetical protein [Gephyromycinifex aptenodytis]